MVQKFPAGHALVIRFTGFLRIDPILGMTFGLVLFWASWGILRDAMNVLLQKTPKRLDLEALESVILDVSGVKGLHHLHAWSITSGKVIFSAHVEVEDYQRGEEIQNIIHDVLRSQFGIYFSTVQIEQHCMDETGAEDIDITDRRTG